MSTIRIDDKSGQAYIPKDYRESGFIGDADVIFHDLVLILIKPGVPRESAVKCLRNVLRRLEQLVEYESNNKPTPHTRS